MDAETSQTTSTESFYKIMAWLHANQKRLGIGAGVVVALGLIAAIIAWNKSQNATNANALLFDLPVASAPNMPAVAPAPTAYLDLAQRYPDTTAGEYALLLGAEALFVEGNYAEAQHQFSKFAEDHPESPLAAQAQVGVAACLEAQGKSSDAIQKYSTIIATYPSDPSITEPAKLTLARLYEQANRPDQSLTLYADLARSQNPYDPWAAEGRERGELLLTKHPELRRAEAAAPSSPLSLGPPGAAPATTPSPQPKPASPSPGLLNFPTTPSKTPGKP